jgi:hypothetical protein
VMPTAVTVLRLDYQLELCLVARWQVTWLGATHDPVHVPGAKAPLGQLLFFRYGMNHARRLEAHFGEPFSRAICDITVRIYKQRPFVVFFGHLTS